MPTPADWYPIFINRSALAKQGVHFNFFHQLSPALSNCDIIFLSSRFFALQQKSIDDHRSALSTITSLKKNNKVVWFDFRDSAGNTQFEVLPYVDLYLKKQLLKDFALYRQTLYGNRLFTDYIHKKLNVYDSYNEPCHPLPLKLEHKVGLSWNPGLLDFRGGIKPALAWHLLTDFLEHSFSIPHQMSWRSPNSPRPFNMLSNFNTNYARRTVAWQRQNINKVLTSLSDPNIIYNQPLSLAREISIRRRSKIILSLFGWGEICSRDFHAFIAGSALLAPDSSHLVTWPTTHIPYQTYYPFKWDLSDLPHAYNNLISNNAKRLSIARAGQSLYKNIWSPIGKKAFVARFNNIITDLLNNQTHNSATLIPHSQQSNSVYHKT